MTILFHEFLDRITKEGGKIQNIIFQGPDLMHSYRIDQFLTMRNRLQTFKITSPSAPKSYYQTSRAIFSWNPAGGNRLEDGGRNFALAGVEAVLKGDVCGEGVFRGRSVVVTLRRFQ
jgi:hypothetical protein